MNNNLYFFKSQLFKLSTTMNIFTQLITNPAIISLFIGLFIGTASTFSLAAHFVELISTYLIFTIGFKGGACLGVANACTAPLMLLTFIGIVIGFLQPFFNYIILRKTTELDRQTAGVVAAQFGSISIVTFITTLSFLHERMIVYDTFMSAIAGIMEIPALLSGIIIIKHIIGKNSKQESIWNVIKAVITCKKINVIFIGFFIGVLVRSYPEGIIHQLVLTPFNAILVLFMIDIGIKIAKQKNALRHFGPSLIAFGIYMPLLHGFLGVVITSIMHLSLGTSLLFTLLLASASYIAVPAIMRIQAKNAKEVIYLPLALGITLPFNILVGIPFFYYCILYLQS